DWPYGGPMPRAQVSKLILAALVAANAIVWIIPSNVVELVARDHQTLLGRYSFPHFFWNAALLLATLITFYIASAQARRERRIRAFRLVAVILSVLFTAVIVDVPLRIKYPPYYK